MILAAYRIHWTEYERGWGCRPDGETYYSNKELALKHIQRHKSGMPTDYVPDCYTVPSDPELVEVTKEVLDRVLEKEKEGKVYWTR